MRKREEFVFRYGVMGCGKTAKALMLRYNYMEGGKNVLLLKPSIDTRDGHGIIRSRIGGMEAPVDEFDPTDNLKVKFKDEIVKSHVIIIDEAQFLTKKQVEQLKEINYLYNKRIYAYGLKVNFKGQLFKGSKRLIELCDKLEHLESLCSCGDTATINARYDKTTRKIIYDGPEILIGGNDSYVPLCWSCWKKGNVPKIGGKKKEK